MVNNKNKVVLGLDASSTTAGIAFIEHPSKKILDAFFVDLSKVETLKEKVQLIIKNIDERNIKFDSINLEAPLSSFSIGRTSQQILIKLIKMNTLTEYILSEHYSIKVNLVGATTARKQLFGKSRIKGIKPKEYVRSQLELKYNLKPYIILNKKNNEDKRTADLLDAIVIGSFYI